MIIRFLFYNLPSQRPQSMKWILPVFIFSFFIQAVSAQNINSDTPVVAVPDTANVGIYINSIYDIDFKLKEFTVSFWLWIKYKKSKDSKNDLDFVNKLEIPNAEKFDKYYPSIDSTTNKDSIYILVKIIAEMKDNWSIRNFPFDHQKMRISIENSQFAANQMVFTVDTVGHVFDSTALFGWTIEKPEVYVHNKVYYTKFGDNTVIKPEQTYSSVRVHLKIKREPWGLFWKMFLGMYIAFLIAYISFYIHHDGIDSRFGLIVGSLFAVIGNKYIIDSSLPETTSFTLVDTLHGMTLFSIFLVLAATAYSLKLVKLDKTRKAIRFDMFFAQLLLTLYILINILLIVQASRIG